MKTKIFPAAEAAGNLSELEIRRNDNIKRNAAMLASIFSAKRNEEEEEVVETNTRQVKVPTILIPVPETRQKKAKHDVTKNTVKCTYCNWSTEVLSTVYNGEISALRGHLQNNNLCKEKRKKNNLDNCFIVSLSNDHKEQITETASCRILHYVYNPKIQKSDYNDCSDLEQLPEEFLNDELIVDDDVVVVAPLLLLSKKFELSSNSIFDHQRELIKEYTRDLKIRGGKMQNDVLDLYKWSVNMSMSLSEKEGDDLLKLIKDMFIRREINIGLHKSWKSLAFSCNKNVKILYPIKEFKITLPEFFFGIHDLQKKPLKQTQCFVFDILRRLGDALLHVKRPDLFATNAIVRNSKTGERVYAEFQTGELFESVNKVVKAEHGNDAVALCIHFSMDGTGCNSSGSVQKCPLTFWIANATQSDILVTFLGYVPEKLPYDDEYLHALLISRHCLVAKDRDDIIKYAKRQIVFDYVHAALLPIVSHQQHGLLVTVGQGPGSFDILALPFFVNFIGDSKSQHQLGAHSLGCKKMQCRKCLQVDCSDSLDEAHTNKVRNSQFMQQLGKLGADVLEQIFTKRIFNKSALLTDKQRDTFKKLKEYNIYPNKNELYILTAWGESKKIPNYCYHNCLDVDYLHTLLKGSIENILSFILLILKTLSRPYNVKVSENFKSLFFNDKKDPKKNLYCNSMTIMDDIISTFPVHHTLLPVKLAKMESVSELMKADDSNKKKGNSTGFISGNIRASSLPGFLLACMFSIGLGGNILPNFQIKSLDDEWKYNPTEIFLNAACAAMEVVYFSHAKELAKSQVDLMSTVIFNSRIHLSEFNNMKQDWLRQFGIIPKLKVNKVEIKKAIKPHLLQHIPGQIRLYGANPQSFDTQLTELSHKRTSKNPWENSSKQTRCGHQEMMMQVVKQEHAEILKNARLYSLDQDTECTQEESNTLKFSFSQQLQSNSLSCDISGNLISHEKHADKFMHYIVNLKILKEKIVTYAFENRGNKENLVANAMDKFFKRQGNDVKLTLLASLKCNGNMPLGIEPFYIRCNRQYEGNRRTKDYISVMSSVDIIWEGGLVSSVIVMAILDILCEDKSHQYMLLTKHYEKVAKSKNFSLPYDLYQYDSSNTFDLIQVESVHRPVFVIPSIDHESTYTFAAEDTLANFKKRKFYIIPFNRCNKNDQNEYDDYVQQFGSAFQTVAKLKAMNVEQKERYDLDDDNNDNNSNSDDDEQDWGEPNNGQKRCR